MVELNTFYKLADGPRVAVTAIDDGIVTFVTRLSQSDRREMPIEEFEATIEKEIPTFTQFPDVPEPVPDLVVGDQVEVTPPDEGA